MTARNKNLFVVLSNSFILLTLLITVSCQPQKKSIPDQQASEMFPGVIDTNTQLPQGFKQTMIASDLNSPSTMIFSPDGRLLIGERIQGKIRVLMPDGKLLSKPMLKLDIPKDEKGQPVRHYSAGIRSFVFDPNYPEKPYLYVFYMKDKPRQNRVSRFRISKDNPNRVVNGSEEVLIDLPFNGVGSSGSNNGGALVFGKDGKLYITTGDGMPAHGPWPEGDSVQSLSTFTGKVLRINRDGSIPQTNPFYDKATGEYRAIYALGLRNPFSVSEHPGDKNIYINDVSLAGGHKNKDQIDKLTAGANYMWEWDADKPGAPFGTPQKPVALAGSRVITGGAWYPRDGYFPPEYRGNYFVALWGASDSCGGRIVRMISEDNNAIKPFLCKEADDGDGMGEPVYTKVGPDGNLYWLSTTYETNKGSVFKISYSEDLDPR